MSPAQMIAWLDRIGLLLQFMAFWLVAPELMGTTRLQRMRAATERLCHALIVLPIGLAIVAGADAVVIWLVDEDIHNRVRGFVIGGGATVVLMGGYVLWRRHTFDRLIHRLQDDHEFRALLARTGAIFFTVGFVLQFIATYE